MIQCRKYWFITFFLNRRYLRFQDSWISGPAKAPNALCSNQTLFLRVLREDGVCGYPPPSCQLRDFTHRWLGNRPATACEHQVKCLWQPCSFQLLCSDNVIRKKKEEEKKKTSNLMFPVLGETSILSRGFWLTSLFHHICASLVRLIDIPMVFVEQKWMLQQTNPKEKVWGLVGLFLPPLYSFVQIWQNCIPTWNTIVCDNKSVDSTAAVPSKTTL